MTSIRDNTMPKLRHSPTESTLIALLNRDGENLSGIITEI